MRERKAEWRMIEERMESNGWEKEGRGGEQAAEVGGSLLVGSAPVEGVIPAAVLPVGILFCERERVCVDSFMSAQEPFGTESFLPSSGVKCELPRTPARGMTAARPSSCSQ